MLQKSVSMYPAIAVPGQHIHFSQVVYTTENFVSDGTARAGHFVFDVTPADADNVYQARVVGIKGEAGAKVLGLVERTLSTYLTYGTEASDVYPKGENLTIAIRGDYAIEAPEDATIGQAVLCDPTTGAISLGEVGATNDTGWVVVRGGAEGEAIYIRNQGVSVVPASASGD